MKNVLDKYQDKEIILLVDNACYKNVVKYVSNLNELYNFKYMKLQELLSLVEVVDKDNYFTIKKDVLPKITKLTGYNLEELKIYLANLKYLNLLDYSKLSIAGKDKFDRLIKVKEVLVNNKDSMLVDNTNYVNYLKSRLIIYLTNRGMLKDNKELLKDFNIKEEIVSFNFIKDLEVKVSKTLDDLYFNVFEEVASLLMTNDLNDIYLVTSNKGDEKLKMYAEIYDINLNIADSRLYDYKLVRDILEMVKDGTIETYTPKDNCLTRGIYRILKKYPLDTLSDTDTYLEIEKEAKETGIVINEYVNYLHIVSVEEALFLEDKHLLVFPLNETIMPHTFKDEDYFLDSNKPSNLDLTTDLNKRSKDNLVDLLKSKNTIHLFGYQREGKVDLKVSKCISDIVKVIDSKRPSYSNYSDKMNKILLTSGMDEYISKYNGISETLDDLRIDSIEPLVSHYGDIYNNYDNSFDNFSYDINSKTIKISYSGYSNYLKSSFEYYVREILGISKYKTTYDIEIGNVVHKVFENYYKSNGNFSFSDELRRVTNENKNLSEYEKKCLLSFEKKLTIVFDAIISIDNEVKAKGYEVEKDSNGNLIGLEREIVKTTVYRGINVMLYAKLDKLYTLEDNGEVFAAIVDYKTGKDRINLKESLIDGKNFQMPFYMYMVHNYLIPGKKVNVEGVYLHRMFTVKGDKLFGESKEYSSHPFIETNVVYGKDEFNDLMIKVEDSIKKMLDIYIDHLVSVDVSSDTNLSYLNARDLSYVDYKNIK